MDRIIKFRGKRKDNEEWIYGNLVIDEGKYYICLGINEHIKRDDYEVYMLEVISETVGQFTELYDEDKKEIYEGDIVKFNLKSDSQGQPDIIGYIEYQTTFCAYRIMSFKGSFALDYNIKNIEVIGNIFDNKNILEEE